MKRECLKIIGTAHVSKESVEEVKGAIYEQNPEVVAIELDYNRYVRLMQEKNGIKQEKSISATEIIKGKQVGVFLTSTILSFFQSRIGAELDIKPGSEMIAAIDAANDIEAKIALIDRDINITLKRAINQMGFLEKAKFILSIILSMFKKDEIDNIEDLKKEETLEEVMQYFKEVSPSAFKVLVQERDAYLTRSILEIEEDNIIAVVGAGHKKGIIQYLDQPNEIPPIEELINTEKTGCPWMKIILFIIIIIFVLLNTKII
ncbi:MAG: TraB family protein [Methanobrevibacter sp.]|jgi:pheromone shutdown-related protein TraB|nr:TraB family protein [Methanobrevibacter sp.]